MRAEAARRADQCREGVACLLGGCIGARLVGIAGPVCLAGCDTSQADARPFSAPYRAVAIPDCRRGAGEGLTGGDDRNRGEEEGEGQHEGMYPLRDVPHPLTRDRPIQMSPSGKSMPFGCTRIGFQEVGRLNRGPEGAAGENVGISRFIKSLGVGQMRSSARN